MPQNMISDTSPKLDGSMKLFYIPFNCFMVKCAYSKFTWKPTGKSADTVIKILWLNVHIYISYHCIQFNAHFLPYFGKYICVVLAWNMKHNNILSIKIANFHQVVPVLATRLKIVSLTLVVSWATRQRDYLLEGVYIFQNIFICELWIVRQWNSSVRVMSW